MGKNGIQYAVVSNTALYSLAAILPFLISLAGGLTSSPWSSQVDAFTAEPFKGNPAAVCLLEDATKAADERWMPSVASEFNLSETAFLLRVRVALLEEEREAAEGAGDGGVVKAGPGRQLEDGERVRVA